MAASLAGELENEAGKTAIAITRDVGVNGLLVYTRLRDCTGQVKLRVVHNGEEMVLTGTIVRHEPVQDSALWRNKVAIAVDTSEPEAAPSAPVDAAGCVSVLPVPVAANTTPTPGMGLA